MKVLDLHCTRGHVFEGWFGSEDDFQAQVQCSRVECPVCGDTQVTKKLTAPRLNLGAAPPAAVPVSGGALAGAPADSPQAVMAGMPQALQAAWLKAVREVMASTEDVGERFAEEARRIHYGETEERGIRGQASADETRALLDEGIAVVPLPLPKALKGPIQ
jgi:hypothetical protein